MSLFNHFYDTGYLPLVVFLTFDKREQYLVCAALRRGREWQLPMLREVFPQARLRVRLDAAGPELLEAEMAGNPRLKRAAALMEPVWKESRSWKRRRLQAGLALQAGRSW